MGAVSAAKCQWSRGTSAAKCLGSLRNGLSFPRSSHSGKLSLSHVQNVLMDQLITASCCSEGTCFSFRWGGRGGGGRSRPSMSLCAPSVHLLPCAREGPWAPLLPSARGPVELLLPPAWVSSATHPPDTHLPPPSSPTPFACQNRFAGCKNALAGAINLQHKSWMAQARLPCKCRPQDTGVLEWCVLQCFPDGVGNVT